MLDFIINPTAGGKHGKKIQKVVGIIEQLLTKKGVDYRLHYTTHKGHAKKLAEDLISNKATDIIVVGGDGTLHEVVNGFTDFNVNLGLVPCGTGNDFAFGLGIPLKPELALDIILSESPKCVDFIQLPKVRGINIVGTGIDVDVLKRYEKLKRKNKFNYTTCLIKTLFSFDYTDFTAKFDDKEIPYRSFIACIANGSVYGGGIPICPVANPTDNKLNFVAVKSMAKLKIIGAFLKLKKGKILSLKQAEHFECSSVDIITDKPCTINVDGELYEDMPFSAKIVSNKLKMYRK